MEGISSTVAHVERVLAFVFGVVVLIVASIALKNDWKSKGLENEVFKMMLALLALGAFLAILASVNVLSGKGVEI
jgi:uncharacterized membrane protein YphA (DoxX/SURF4 family)